MFIKDSLSRYGFLLSKVSILQTALCFAAWYCGPGVRGAHRKHPWWGGGGARLYGGDGIYHARGQVATFDLLPGLQQYDVINLERELWRTGGRGSDAVAVGSYAGMWKKWLQKRTFHLTRQAFSSWKLVRVAKHKQNFKTLLHVLASQCVFSSSSVVKTK